MNNAKWKPFGRNIMFAPLSKDKIIGDTSKFFLIGTVLAIGSEVKTVKVGDQIGYTQWALNKIVTPDKKEAFFCHEDDDYILGIYDSNE